MSARSVFVVLVLYVFVCWAIYAIAFAACS